MSFDRRTLLRTATMALLVEAAGCKDNDSDAKKSAAKTPDDDAADASPKNALGPPALAKAVLDTISSVAERILPSDGDGPGAKEANVGAYLAVALADPRMKNMVPLMNRAAGYLVRFAQTEHKIATFSALSDDQKDDILKRLSEGKVRPDRFNGQGFMQIMVALTLEGYLGDPRHGGNKDKIAWAHLGFDDVKGRGEMFAARPAGSRP